MYCGNCGREIDDKAVICPHCGVAVGRKNVQTEEGNTLAIVGFIFSFFIALVGLICSILGYKKSKNEGAPHQGLALAGIIISAVSIGLTILIYIIVIAAVGATL